MGYVKISFPCGFGIEAHALGLAPDIEMDGKKSLGCPIHGKDCVQPAKWYAPQPAKKKS